MHIRRYGGFISFRERTKRQICSLRNIFRRDEILKKANIMKNKSTVVSRISNAVKHYELKPNSLMNIVFLSLAPVFILVVYKIYGQYYFFLFDDYMLLNVASENSLINLYNTPYIGFYRPLALHLMKTQFFLFGWERPEFYLVVTITMHYINTWLVFLLSGRYLKNNTVSVVASTIFLITPWAAETIFWVSCQFDIFSAFFILLALFAATYLNNNISIIKYINIVLVIQLFTLCALLSKEISVSVPLLLVICCLYTQDRKCLLSSRTIILAAITSLNVLVFLLARKSLLGGMLDYPYGSYFDLIKASNPATILNPILYLLINTNSALQAKIMQMIYGMSLLSITVFALIAGRKNAVLSLVLAILAMTPVIWYNFMPYNSYGGRYFYFPDIFLCIFLGLSFNGNSRTLSYLKISGLSVLRGYRIILYAVFFVFVSYSLMSLNYQRKIWILSSNINRFCIEKFRQNYNRANNNYFIDDLPHIFAEGPYIMKSYAFRFYFRDPDIKVKSLATILSYNNGHAAIKDIFIDPYSDEVDRNSAIFIRME